MNFKHLILPICFAFSLISCEKSNQDDALAQSPEPTKKSNSEFPYEVFEPNVADEALAFYEST